MNEYPESEIVNMIFEHDEDATDYIYEKYSYIVDVLCNKYKKFCRNKGIDFKELRQEALLGFSDGITKFKDDKDAALKTFLSICIERRITNFIRKEVNNKHQMIKDTISLDLEVTPDGDTLLSFLGDLKNEPLRNIEQQEDIINIRKKINEALSPSELDVYHLMINNFSHNDIASILKLSDKQVYNTMGRIRMKIKDIL